MHPKNPFAADYDFDLLIQHVPALRDFVFVNEYGTKTIKFADKQAVKSLNKALLKAYYGVDWDIPDTNLTPPIPGRLDYLLHIADLIPKKDIRLLDIGTGASLIYPILATCHFHWQCTGSDTDRTSLKNAHNLIDTNAVLGYTKLRHQPSRNNVLVNIIRPGDAFDVVVCNPPFYESLAEAEQHNQRKVTNLKLKEKSTRNFGGRFHELWYKGGETEFVRKMAQESIIFKDQVHWFTSLVSKSENLRSILKAIRQTEPKEVKVVDMDLGNKKSRFVAWKFR